MTLSDFTIKSPSTIALSQSSSKGSCVFFSIFRNGRYRGRERTTACALTNNCQKAVWLRLLSVAQTLSDFDFSSGMNGAHSGCSQCAPLRNIYGLYFLLGRLLYACTVCICFPNGFYCLAARQMSLTGTADDLSRVPDNSRVQSRRERKWLHFHKKLPFLLAGLFGFLKLTTVIITIYNTTTRQ